MTDKALKIVAEQAEPTVPALAVDHKQAIFTAEGGATTATSPDSRASFLADLVLHQATETPLCVAFFGGAGVGKSTLLATTAAAVEKLGRAAEAAGLATPFVGSPTLVRITVEPGREPYASLLDQTCAALAETHPDLVAGVAQGNDDPQTAARDSQDRLSAARHRLDDERRRLDELTARQARLVDAILFEGAGSRLDAYARANRGRIDRALRRFGFTDDTAVTYKELVRDAAEPGLGRGLGWLSAFWAYRGQSRLLIVALVFFLMAWLTGSLLGHQAELVDALRGSNDKMGPAADWLGAHAPWLESVRQVLELAGLAALAMNVVRAIRFIQPIARGATLLRGDLDGRRHDLDGLVAHQAQRVEGLARDIEMESLRAAEAERRLAAGARPTLPAELRGRLGPAAIALRFFSGLSGSIAASAEDGRSQRRTTRLVVTIDGFEQVPPEAAAAFLQAAHLCLARPGIVTLLAADRDQLAAGLAEADPALARAALDRVVQVPMTLQGSDDTPWPEARVMAQALLRPLAKDSPSIVSTPDAGRSAFEKAWAPKEATVLEALAPFAGGTPRAVKRFVNLYRVARADPALDGAGPADLAALAASLALAQNGGLPPASLLANGGALPENFQAARHTAATALGFTVDLGRESRGLEVARRYTIA